MSDAPSRIDPRVEQLPDAGFHLHVKNNSPGDPPRCQWCRAPAPSALDFIHVNDRGPRVTVCQECQQRYIAHQCAVAERRSALAAKEYARCLRLGPYG